MARTRRPPAPQNVRQLRGETRPSRTRIDPQPTEQRPDPPDWLNPEARAIWDRQVTEMEAMNLLFPADEDLLSAYCSSAAMFAEAERALASQGLVVDDHEHPGRTKRNPWILIRRDALNQVARLAPALGFSPQARAHLAVSAKEREKFPGEDLLSS